MALTKVSAGVLNIDDLYGFRNRVINGDMQIDQRNAGANVTITLNGTGVANSQFVTDRWYVYGYNTSGDFDVVANTQQFSDHPLAGSNGKCLRIVITTGDTPNTANIDFLSFLQRVEGANCWDLYNSPTTLSFWVKTNVTGTYGIQIRANGNTDDLQNPNFWTTFQVTQAGIWQYITKNVPAQTLSTIRSDNGTGYSLHINLVSGLNANFDASIANLNNTWFRYNSDGVASTALTNTFASTAGNYFQLTDVQMEKGSNPTPFERLPFTTELALCQRYFEKSYNQGNSPGATVSNGAVFGIRGNGSGVSSVLFKTTKRTSPTVTIYSSVTGTSGKVRNANSGADENGTVGFISDNGFNCSPATSNISDVYYFQYTVEAEL
jgi:hypothetical protein